MAQNFHEVHEKISVHENIIVNILLLHISALILVWVIYIYIYIYIYFILKLFSPTKCDTLIKHTGIYFSAWHIKNSEQIILPYLMKDLKAHWHGEKLHFK